MGQIASVFGGGKKSTGSSTPAPVQTIAKTKQESISATPASKQKRSVARSGSSGLVAGRVGTPTRGGVNIPGRV